MSTITAWRWLKVPRCESCPVRRTGVPASRREAIGDELGHAVVEEALAFAHLLALLEELLHLGMNVEVGGIGGERRDELVDALGASRPVAIVVFGVRSSPPW